jgi:hypothetical protein
MQKGVSKRQAEEDEVLGRCIRIVSTFYLKKPFPVLSQFASRKDLDELIEDNRKEYINLSTYELQELIFNQGNKLKALIEDNLLEYYLL